MRRGGNAQRWWESKDFTEQQKHAIREEVQKMLDKEISGLRFLMVEHEQR